MAHFDQRDQHVGNQYNAGHDINYAEHNHPLYVPPKPPARQRLLPSIIGIIVFALFMGGVYVVSQNYSFSEHHTLHSNAPDEVLSGYCFSLQSGDLQGAYNDYSSGLKNQITSTDFVNMWSNRHIDNCVPSISSSSNQQASGTISTSVFPPYSATPTNGPPPDITKTYSVMLIKDSNGDWKIDSIQ